MNKNSTLLVYFLCFLFVSFLILLNTNYSLAQECTQNSDCPTGECIRVIKGKTYNRCVKCTDDSHCSGTLNKCRVKSNSPYHNRCVECLNEYDCGGDKHCVDNTCYVCTNDSHCSGGLNACLRNRANQGGRCVECTRNNHCNFGQVCDASINSCKQDLQVPEPEIDPNKYQIDKYKNKSLHQPSLRQQEISPEIQQKSIEQKLSPENTIPKDIDPKSTNTR